MNKKFTNHSLNFVSICIFGILLFSLTGCSKFAEKKQALNEMPEETIFAVNAYRIKSGNLDDYLLFGGNVQTSSSVDIYPSMVGKISFINVRVGQYVYKDQVIMEIDASRAGMDFKSSPVKAPVSGTITKMPYNIGTTVATSMSVGQIGNTAWLEIKSNVAERFVSKLSIGQKAEVTFESFPGEVFFATLTKMDPVLDSSSRTIGIKLILDKRDSRIKAGMYAKIKLVTETKESVIILPNKVVVTRNGKDIVYVINEETKTVMPRQVTAGLRIDDKQEILDGLNEGELVVVKGQALLSENSKVKIISITGEDKNIQAEEQEQDKAADDKQNQTEPNETAEKKTVETENKSEKNEEA